MKLTIRLERSDGQFTVAETDLPDRVPESDSARNAISDKVLLGFIDAYRRCAELPEGTGGLPSLVLADPSWGNRQRVQTAIEKAGFRVSQVGAGDRWVLELAEGER